MNNLPANSLDELNFQFDKVSQQSIVDYCHLIGKIKGYFANKQKHWWHLALIPNIKGLSSGILYKSGHYFEVSINLSSSQLIIDFLNNNSEVLPLTGQSAQQLFVAISDKLKQKEITIELDSDSLPDISRDNFNPTYALQVLNLVNFISHNLQKIKAKQRQETGPVVLWPHHFDIAFLWFSGRLVPGTDPNDEESSDEQVNLGFSFGDETINEPYFYITAYPWQDGFSNTKLPEQAYWQKEGFNGAILLLSKLQESQNKGYILESFCLNVLEQAKQLMS